MSDVAWIHYARPRTRWYGLPPAQRGPLERAFADARSRSRDAGGRQLGTFHVRGQSDFSTVELWRFSSAQDAYEHWARMTNSGYAEWFAFANSLGQALNEMP